jgi:uncharacterized Tic20 family protein
MKRHENNSRGFMGAAVIAVLGIFLALHLALPGVTLWPAGLGVLAVVTMVTMVVSHIQRRNGISHRHPVRTNSIDR